MGRKEATDSGPLKDAKKAPSRQLRLWPQPSWVIFLVLVVANHVLVRLLFPEPSSITIPYSFFKAQIEAGNIADVVSVGESIRGSFKTEVTFPPGRSEPPHVNAPPSPPGDPIAPETSKRFRTQRPAFADPGLERLLEDKGVAIEALDESVSSWFKLLVSFGPTILLIAAFVWMSRRAAAAGGGVFNLGRSRAKRYNETQPKVTFE